ncbi:MAG: glycosyltransferase [Acidobacteriota bacterium]
MKREARVRVLFFVPQLSLGGAEKQVALLVQGLERTRFEPRVVCLYPGGYWFSHLLRAGVVPVVVRGSSFPGRVLALRREVHRFRPQIVQTFLHRGNLYGAVNRVLLPGHRLVISERGLGTRMSRTKRLAIRLASRVAASLVVNCRANVRRLIEECGVPPTRVRVIYNGVRPRAGPVRGEKKPGVRLLSILHFTPSKNVPLLLRAVSLLKDEFPEIRCRIVGGGPGESSGRELASQLHVEKQVLFLGEQEDVSPEFETADIFVLPSRSEGLSNALLEAMQAGLPCVATRVGGNPELIEHETTGLLVSSSDPASMAAALRKLLRDPSLAERMGRRGASRAAAMFALPRMVRDYERLYRRLLIA